MEQLWWKKAKVKMLYISVHIQLVKSIRNVGSREESEVSGFFVFSHTRMMGYFRLG